MRTQSMTSLCLLLLVASIILIHAVKLGSISQKKEQLINAAKTKAFNTVYQALKKYVPRIFKEVPVFDEMLSFYKDFLKHSPTFKAPEPACDMNPQQLIESMGYQVEVHFVTTKDNYILQIFRIPCGKEAGQTPGVPILLQHGITSAADTWIVNFPDQSLAFMLADAGYDVWLGNIRGNTWSKKHKTLSTKDKSYWKFSWQEMAKYDIPAVIEYILKITNQKQIFYVGHSMGTTMSFAMLSSEDTIQYNSKIKHAFALGPVATLHHTNSLLLRLLAKYQTPVFAVLKSVRWYHLFDSNKFEKYFAQYFCTLVPLRSLCYTMDQEVYGKQSENFNKTRIPVYMSHLPAGASTKTLEHFSQTSRANRFQKFDYGFIKNLFYYGKVRPPLYDLGKIKTPYTLIYGRNDTIATVAEAKYIYARLKNATLIQTEKDCSHRDLTLGIFAGTTTNKIILDTLRKYN